MATISSSSSSLFKLLSIIIFITLFFTPQTLVLANCTSETTNSCNNKDKALDLKIIAIFTILIASLIGVCLPLFTRSIPLLRPESNVFIVVKCFAAGIILGTGFVHVLPDSFDMLWSDCLEKKPWREFPFPGLVAMIAAIVTLMVDSMATTIYSRKSRCGVKPEVVNRSDVNDQEMGTVDSGHFQHHHQHQHEQDKTDSEESRLMRYRVVAMVLELGIVVHSVVIGLSMGASNNTCTIRGLVAAMCFHQMFEGMGLGGCILQAEYKWLKNSAMVFFFSVTTPFGIALGIAMSKIYKENSPTALITVGLLNAASAGLLVYMALVDLLAADFMGPTLQKSIKLQLKCFLAVFLGAAGMSIMAKWA